ncbi:NAD-dependent epimerase/dehydratase family protein [Streptomyces sp. NPDC001315]|uniref:NAD-dependent epimerase/dehydratase family protein n=1 Tax=Streptomyces sp. NPDC001315 TaxID=3364562 RepID=UPI00367D449A
MTQGRPVLVLGATGFLGRHIAEAFAGAGDAVVRAARSGPLRVDLTTIATWELAALLHRIRPAVVVNAAGRAWQATDQEMWEANAVAVERLAGAMTDLPDAPRLIQLGSVHEYGPGTPGTGTTEDRVPAPVTAYGRSKLHGSQAVLAAAGTTGLDAVVLRLGNVYGPGTARGSLLGAVGAQLAQAGDGPLELRLGPLTARRDFVDVRDAVDAVRAAATVAGLGPEGRVVNIGSGTAVPTRDLVERLIDLSGVPVDIVDEGSGGPARADVEWQQLDISKARRLLGWHPRRDPDDSLRDLLATERNDILEGTT